jgi:outer membrane protein assembly factor BamE (lipoprotein component of BamABCDE complex)
VNETSGRLGLYPPKDVVIGSHNGCEGQMKRSGFHLFIGPAAALVLMLSACSPTMNNHGNIPDEELVESIRIGVNNREQVSSMLGTPSTIATFDKEAWYYVGERTSRIAFFEPKLLERKVLVIRFNKNGIVRQVERLDKNSGREIQVVDRKTPTRGKELTILEQLLGNVGRFGGVEGDDGGDGF